MGKGYLRTQLGLLKWNLTEVWPADLRVAKAARLRQSWDKWLESLPPVDASASAGLDLEVHMLCGEKTSDMGMWSSWSLMRFIPQAMFYLHSDGTLSDRTIGRWQRILPRMVVVGLDEANALVQSAWGGRFPHLKRWRERSLIAVQNIDYSLCGTRRYILSMDSDVLCFKPPHEIIAAVESSKSQIRWMHDSMYAYHVPEDEFRKRYGDRLPLRVNGGFWVSERFSEPVFQAMEQELAGWRGVWASDSWWMPQTLLAVACGVIGGKPLDSHRYMMGFGGHSNEYVARHYTGPKFFRPRFFTEGIRAALRGE